MYCESCGNTLNPNDKFCEKCGAGVTVAPIYAESTHVDAPRLQSSNIKFTKRSLACIILADLCLFLFILNILKFVMSDFGHSRIHWVLNIWGLISVLLGGALSVYACAYTSRRYDKTKKRRFLAITFLITGLTWALSLASRLNSIVVYGFRISDPVNIVVLSVFSVIALSSFTTSVLLFIKKRATFFFYLTVDLILLIEIGSLQNIPHMLQDYGFDTVYFDWEGFILYLAGQILNLLLPVLLIVIFNQNRKHDIYEEYKPLF